MNDGVNTYTYDSANRLKAISNQQSAISYTYNGLNDRLQEIVNGSPTTFTMDLNAGLTQALSDGTRAYIYGNGRIAQVGTGTEYFLGDALGSVRQMTQASGTLTYGKAYDPYGVVTAGAGTSQSAYGYTSEYTSQGLVYLRARHYAPDLGRFLTRDTWGGIQNLPITLNKWVYANDNPVLLTDPSGHFCVPCLIVILVALGAITSGCSASNIPPTPDATSTTVPEDYLYRLTYTDWEGLGLVNFTGNAPWDSLSKEAVLLSLDMIQRASNKSPSSVVSWILGAKGGTTLEIKGNLGNSIGGSYNGGIMDLYAVNTPGYLTPEGTALLVHEMAHGIDESLGIALGLKNYSGRLQDGHAWIPDWQSCGPNCYQFVGDDDGPANTYAKTTWHEDFASSFASVVIEININMGVMNVDGRLNLSPYIQLRGGLGGQVPWPAHGYVDDMRRTAIKDILGTP